MRRKDRLVDLISTLRDGRVHRAEDLARRHGVSLRSIYRDFDVLKASGVPVEGARGHGYRMTEAVTLPPLNLSRAELEALHLGVAVMTEATDPDLQQAARGLASKLDQAMPEDRAGPTAAWGLAIFPFADTAAGIRNIPALRRAIRTRHKLRIDYYEPSQAIETHDIRPLKLDYWGRVWTCTAWSEARKEIRTFRVDRISELTELSQRFDNPGPETEATSTP